MNAILRDETCDAGSLTLSSSVESIGVFKNITEELLSFLDENIVSINIKILKTLLLS